MEAQNAGGAEVAEAPAVADVVEKQPVFHSTVAARLRDCGMGGGGGGIGFYQHNYL